MLFSLCLSIVGLALIGLAVLVRAAFTAPYGVEDEEGFHLQPGSEEPQVTTVAAMPVTTPDLAFFNR